MLRRQVEKSRRPDATIDIDALLEIVSRTYTEDEEDSRRTDRSIQLMVEELEAANQTLSHTSTQLQVTLEAVRHGIIMVSEEGQIDVCNSMARELLRLPESCAGGSFPYSKLARYLRTLDLLENIDDRTVLIAAPGGLEVEIHVHPTSKGGTVILVEDVTGDRQRERALRQAETEYRSLFENSVLGIYRDQLDGTPVRANPAFVAMNGYASEAELIEAVTRNPNSWYVDQDRGNQVLETLKREGRVRDLISQLYRHRTREPMWVTENAWYVRDENGTPLFIEGTMQDASERMASEEAMKRLVNVDLLTGAKSRFRFMQRLQEEVSRPNNSFVLYCLDLDMFKDVNDVFGHAAGDSV
jgi:PAS domain S-box-containing protein